MGRKDGRAKLNTQGLNDKAGADGTASGVEGSIDRSSIIDHLYQVAIDPERFETLLDLWEEKVAPQRRNGRERDEPPLFNDIEIELHAERAALVLDKVDNRSRDDILGSIVATINPSAAFILNGDSFIAAANQSAQIVFGIEAGCPASSLRINPSHVNGITSEARKIGTGANGATSLLRFSPDETANAMVFRMRKLNLPSQEGTLVLVVSSELAWPDALGPTMQEAFGLTTAETEIVRSLTEGISLRDIAERRGRSPATVKTQLRSILAKTDTHTQADLVRVTLGLMDVVSATETRSRDTKKRDDRPPRLLNIGFNSLRRSGNRQVDYLVLGDPNGKPVLYLHFDFGLTRLPASAETHAAQNGIRIIVPVRPGFGHTTNVSDRSSLLTTIIEDTRAVLDQCTVDKCPIVSSGGDSFFAYHLVNAYPERFSAILNASAGFPVTLPAQYERMEKWHRFILANARYAPNVLPFLVKAGFSLAKRIGKRDFLSAVYAKSPADTAVINDPEIIEAMLTGSDICLSDWHSAHAAYANEVIIKQEDWSGLITDCKVPVHVWYGDEDPQVPPQTMQEFMAGFPDIRYQKLEDAGQLLLFRHWRTILETAQRYT